MIELEKLLIYFKYDGFCYPNMLVLADLARVQCVSTTTCERAFRIQNLIKTREISMEVIIWKLCLELLWRAR